MADSDSGTHVTDISESVQDDVESTGKQGMLEPINDMAGSKNLLDSTSKNAIPNVVTPNSVPNERENDDDSWTITKDINALAEPPHKNTVRSTPQLTRRPSIGHVPSRAVSPAHHVPSRASSPVCYTINHEASPVRHVPSRATSPVHLVARRATSPDRYTSSRPASPSRGFPSRVSSPIRHSSSRSGSPAQFAPNRANSPPGRLSRRRSLSSGRVPYRAGTPRDQVIAAHVHDTPRRYRKSNGNLTSEGHVPAKRQRRTPQKSVTYGGSMSRGDNPGFLRSMDSIRLNSGTRTAYDFAEPNRYVTHKSQPNSRQVDDVDADLDMNDREGHGNVGDEKSWLPTGIYAVFLITLWTAVLKLVDSVEGNGPSACTAGEETRLWICAGSFTLVQGLAEAFWQRKNLLKVLFSMTCLFGYFITLHTEPLSCRLGEEQVTEISKWQSAINFFMSALLAISIYKHIVQEMQERKRNKRKRRREEVEKDEFEGLPEYIL